VPQNCKLNLSFVEFLIFTTQSHCYPHRKYRNHSATLNIKLKSENKSLNLCSLESLEVQFYVLSRGDCKVYQGPRNFNCRQEKYCCSSLSADFLFKEFYPRSGRAGVIVCQGTCLAMYWLVIWWWMWPTYHLIFLQVCFAQGEWNDFHVDMQVFFLLFLCLGILVPCRCVLMIFFLIYKV
jgi:hypothetical protein